MCVIIGDFLTLGFSVYHITDKIRSVNLILNVMSQIVDNLKLAFYNQISFDKFCYFHLADDLSRPRIINDIIVKSESCL